MSDSSANQSSLPNPEQQAAHEELLGQRSSGVLLHISSLPSRFGIGDLGPSAYRFADFLQAAGQRYWQILPLNPTKPGAGESPYFSSSAFAGNPMLVDLDALVDAGLLTAEEAIAPAELPPERVEFPRVRAQKMALLTRACERFLDAGTDEDYETFCREEAGWLDDFALYTVLEEHYQHVSWSEWPQPLRDREPAALAGVAQEHARPIALQKVMQFFFARQWDALKTYCNERGLLLFGDMPIYVSYESADVWAHPDIFKLDAQRRPTAVSGVPPDYFSATGQLWNNPVYNWDKLREQHYDWWVRRMGALFERYDVVRIDHFRGLVQYWEVPAGAETALEGQWQDVPTYELFDTLRAAYPHFPVVAEDLGIITPDVVAVKEHYALPGMLVLQFAFGEDGDHNPYLPPNHPEAAVVYLGTHDNNTSGGWLAEADEATLGRLRHHLVRDTTPASVRDLIELALSSRANIAIITAQDLLALSAAARMNDPSLPEDNWAWRMTPEQFDQLPMADLRDLTRRYQRAWQAAPA